MKKFIFFKLLLTIIMLTNDSYAYASHDIEYSALEQSLINQGYIDIQKMEPSIQTSIIYATAHNFVGRKLYSNLTHAFLHREAATGLIKAQKYLKLKQPRYSLIVYDALRPLSVQQQMWDKVKNTNKSKYVSNPKNGGGLHNYGLAVDISIVDGENKPLNMGVPVDHLGSESNIDKEQYFYQKEIFSKQVLENRELLREVMNKGGFKPLKSEWWHFNFKSRSEAKQYYKAVY